MSDVENVGDEVSDIAKIKDSLVELHNVITGKNMTEEEITEDFLNHKFDSEGLKLKCKKCGEIFNPFFFGDKPLDRGVIQDCPYCGCINSFNPLQVTTADKEGMVLTGR
jgi:hypothetical protein